MYKYSGILALWEKTPSENSAGIKHLVSIFSRSSDP